MKSQTKLRVRTSAGIVPAEVVEDDGANVYVRLPDGTVIRRNKRKHVVPEPEKATA